MSDSCEVAIRFFAPPEELRRYFTTFYLIEVKVPDGGEVTDYLHPEWANFRFHSGALPVARMRDGSTMPRTAFAVTGPSSAAIRFTVGSTRMWGVGILPLGWAKFVCTPAARFADLAVDGNIHAEFAALRPLAQDIFADEPDLDGELARIARHFLERLDNPLPDEDRIFAIHAALVDPDTRNVADLAERAGVTSRTVERVCHRAFGFPPRLLLRRQRFMRSLAHFMLDPSLNWIGAMDGHYHDQAQFVRDFRQFMGMRPREYAALPKPILGAVLFERARFAGAAVQTLDGPDGARVSD
ncbi:MAG TPA: helix-turn-helix domain-containing protein [Novosphingobium sp.]